MCAATTLNALLVYPCFPPSYWGFQYAIELMGKRSAMPPLGLITVAAMFPSHYQLRLVDTNVTELSDQDLDWADLVLTSSMVVQQRSLREVIARCNRRGTPVVVGGPYPSSFGDDLVGADFLILDEVEESFPGFLADWEAGRAQQVVRPQRRPPIAASPVPRFDLLELDAYSSMALQFSRGCPFNCEFCDITKLFGRVPRTKSTPQMLAELDALDAIGWRGPVFLVDDNFIGNRHEALRLLPAVAAWQRQRAYPFDLFTEASVDLARHEPLLTAMVDAGFSMVFVGIESPNPEALRQTRKPQNTRSGDGDFLLHAVQTIQRHGIEVAGGFILGLDGDGPEVFDAQVDFIQAAGIPRAMVGLLSAFRGTDLYARLEAEGRLVGEASGNNVEIALNFRPQLAPQVLVDGYRRVLSTLYPPGLASYFARCWTMIATLGPGVTGRRRQYTLAKLLALLRSLCRQTLSRQAPAYLGFLLRTLVHRPRQLGLAIRLAIMGLHFEKFTLQTLATHDFSTAARTACDRVEGVAMAAAAPTAGLGASLRRDTDAALRRLRRLHRRLRPEFQRNLVPNLAEVEQAIQSCLSDASTIEPLRRAQAQIEQWFTGQAWRRTLETHGYALASRWRAGASMRTLAFAPLLAHDRMRRSLERFLRELGVQVMSLPEQVARIGEERLTSLLRPDDAPDRLVSYLRALGQHADALVVPCPELLVAGGDRVQVLSVGAATANLPHVVCVACQSSRRQLRTSLVELGVALTGNPGRAAIAFESAFALF